MNLQDVGEEALLQQLFPHLPLNRDVIAGAGDDCAVARFGRSGDLLVLKTDCVVEEVHFTAAARPSAVGWKAMARPLSDFAAMSARPRFGLVTLIAPPTRRVRWVTELYRGLAKAAKAFDVAIVGGETSRTNGPVIVSVSIVGSAEKERLVRRSGGQPGDDLFVTGRLGGSLGGRHLRFTPRIHESRWLTANFPVHAMMDLSDGLGADLPRLAAASGVGFEVEENAIPRHRGVSVSSAVSDGEDYELLFAVSPQDTAVLLRKWKQQWPLELTRIGRLTTAAEGSATLARGYAHYA